MTSCGDGGASPPNPPPGRGGLGDVRLPAHPLLRHSWGGGPAAMNSLGVSEGILPNRCAATPPQRWWAAARPRPKHPQKQVAPGGNPTKGPLPGEAHLGSTTREACPSRFRA